MDVKQFCCSVREVQVDFFPLAEPLEPNSGHENRGVFHHDRVGVAVIMNDVRAVGGNVYGLVEEVDDLPVREGLAVMGPVTVLVQADLVDLLALFQQGKYLFGDFGEISFHAYIL